MYAVSAVPGASSDIGVIYAVTIEPENYIPVPELSRARLSVLGLSYPKTEKRHSDKIQRGAGGARNCE